MLRKLILIACLLTVSACGSSGRNWEMSSTQSGERMATVAVEFAETSVPMSPEVISYMREDLTKKLKEIGFQNGNQLRLYIYFEQFDEGSRAMRYFFGGIGDAGQGSLTVRTRYVNLAGTVLAETRTEGKIGAGFFGGSFDSAIKEVNERIAEYASYNFLGR